MKTPIDDIEILILPVPIFLATKWEAFKSRGSDPRLSHNFEDIIYILDNNLELVDEALEASSEVKTALKALSSFILEHPNRQEIIECHINQITAHEGGEFILETLLRINPL